MQRYLHCPGLPDVPFYPADILLFHIGLSSTHSISFLRRYQRDLFKLFLFLVGIAILGTRDSLFVPTLTFPILASIFFNELTDIDAFDDAPILYHIRSCRRLYTLPSDFSKRGNRTAGRCSRPSDLFGSYDGSRCPFPTNTYLLSKPLCSLE